MAKVRNSIIGELSGKLGGMVFSRNKSGAIVRANVKGINPRTVAQLKARQAFKYASVLFRNVSNTNKVLWQEFADNYYNPKNGTNNGQYSGYNAFMGLRNITNDASQSAENGEVGVNGAIPSEETNIDYIAMPDTPIGKSFVGAVVDSTTDNVIPLSVKEAEITIDGNWKVVLSIGDESGYDIVDFADPNGYEIGLGVYISYGSPDGSKEFQNINAQKLDYIKPLEKGLGILGMDDAQTIEFRPISTVDISSFKRYPLVGEDVYLNVYAINKYGQMSLIGGKVAECLTGLS